MKTIEDFGQKIDGARKDVWKDFSRSIAGALPADMSDFTMAEHFPAIDHEAAIARGACPDNLAVLQAVRDMIPAKPRKIYKLNQWSALVTACHQIAQKICAGQMNIPRERLDEVLRCTSGPVAETVNFYRRLAFPACTRANGWKITAGRFYNEAGAPQLTAYATKDRVVMFRSISPDIEAARAELIEQVRAAIISELTEPAKTETKFSIYQERRTGEFFIGKKAARGVVRIRQGFTTLKDCRECLTRDNAELQAAWARMSAAPQLRKAANLPRLGVSRREADIAPDSFLSTFGFRGVQFGNYVEADRRQADLNESHDALRDMAEAIGLSPSCLSLGGSLGLAFGARGTGGHKAHFEPGQIVINITKTNGPGSLAHEWFHALDNYLARIEEGLPAFSEKFITADFSTAQIICPELLAAFANIRRAVSRGGFNDRSNKLDECRSKPYYGTTIEKAARAFEIWVSDKLASAGIFNDYLANIYKDESCSAYPTPDEMAGGIRAAFDAAFSTLTRSAVFTGTP